MVGILRMHEISKIKSIYIFLKAKKAAIGMIVIQYDDKMLLMHWQAAKGKTKMIIYRLSFRDLKNQQIIIIATRCIAKT